MLRAFWTEEDGTTAMEYALIGTLIFATASSAMAAYGEALADNIYEIIDGISGTI